MRILLVFFALFPMGKKVRVPPRVRVRSCPGVSSWTPAAYVVPSGSDEWVKLHDDVQSRTFYWNRRTHLSSWLPPEGIMVVWVGTMDEEGDYYYWHRKHVPVHMSFFLFLLSEELHRQPRAVHKNWAPCRLCWEDTYAVGWFLSTAPRIWQSLVRCSPWFDSGHMLRQFTAASVGDC